MIPTFLAHDLYLIFNPETELGRKTRALAPTISGIVHEIDVKSKWVTPFRWKEIINLLHAQSAKELVNPAHPDYAKILGSKDFSERDLLEILYQNPQLIKGPIGVLENHAVMCENAADILNLEHTPAAEHEAYGS
jgi:arsenate reductase-like glutaredoxin family protein